MKAAWPAPDADGRTPGHCPVTALALSDNMCENSQTARGPAVTDEVRPPGKVGTDGGSAVNDELGGSGAR